MQLDQHDDIEEIARAFSMDDEIMIQAGVNQWGGWFNFDTSNQKGGVESGSETSEEDVPVDLANDCLDAWENINLDNLFKLTKLGERHLKKFNSFEMRYEVEVAPLPCILTAEKSMQIMPKILKKFWKYARRSAIRTIELCCHWYRSSKRSCPDPKHKREIRQKHKHCSQR